MKPTLHDLNDPGKFDRIASVEQDNIKDFVIEQVLHDKKIIPVYMVYQTLMLLICIFFLTRAIVLAYKGNPSYLLVTAGAVLFSFTVLVAIHELIHGIALKLTGARRVTFGAILRKFLFYAEADKHILGKESFHFVALTPLVFIQTVTVAGIIIWFSYPFVYFFLMLMTIHSFFCSGDIALLTIFYRFPGRDTFTYDDRTEKISYYFVRK